MKHFENYKTSVDYVIVDAIKGFIFLFIVGFIFYVACSGPEEKPKSERQQLIDKQFHAVYGYHINVTDSVKRLLQPIAEFEVVDTRYWEQGQKLRIKARFRVDGIDYFAAADVTLYGTITHLSTK
jgi:hypothetical protein